MKENFDQKRIDVYVEKFRLHLQRQNSLPDDVVDAIVNMSKPRKYKRDEIFSKQGEFSDKTAYNCSGIFSVFSTQEEGTLFVANFLKEGDFVQGAFDVSEPNTFTIQALCDCVVVEFSKKVIHDMYLEYPQLGEFARCIIEKYFVAYAAHMIQLGSKKTEENYLQFRNNYQGEEDHIPQHLIAAYLGITPTQLSRIRKKLSSAQQALKSIKL